MRSGVDVSGAKGMVKAVRSIKRTAGEEAELCLLGRGRAISEEDGEQAELWFASDGKRPRRTQKSRRSRREVLGT